MEEAEAIKDFYSDDYLFVLSEYNAENSANKFLKIRGYSMSFKVSTGLNHILFYFVFFFYFNYFFKKEGVCFTKIYEQSFEIEQNYKLIKEKKHHDKYILLIESQLNDNESMLNCYEIDFKLLEEKPLQMLHESKIINIELPKKRSDSLLDSVTITLSTSSTGAKYLILFYNFRLSFIDFDTLKLISKKDLLNNDSEKLLHIEPIANTNSFIALNNCKDLVYINYDPIENVISLAKAKNTQSAEEYESFRLNDKYVLAATKTEIIGFDLNGLIKQSSFEKCEFKIGINKNNSLDLYGFSLDLKYVYTIENKRQLRFYRYSDGQKLADIPLYCEASCVLCSNDYVCLFMQDKRVISYFIFDSGDEKGSIEKIKSLPSR